MEKLGYYNGEWGPLEEMVVPMNDRASFYGDGVYDATMTKDGVILYEDEHIERFFNSMRLLGFKPNFTPDELREILRDMTSKMDAPVNFLYWQVTRGTGIRDHRFPDCEPNLWVTLVPDEFSDLDEEVNLSVMDDRRFLYCNAKTLNLIPNVLAAQKAEEEGCSETIFVRDGIVTECAHSNIHILKHGCLITHPADDKILPGIARKHLIAMCYELGIPVEEREYSLEELMDADEVIMSSSSTFAMRVATVSGKSVGHRDKETYDRLRFALEHEADEYLSRGRR